MLAQNRCQLVEGQTMTQNTASSTEGHLFLCVRTQLHSQIGGKCPNVSVLVEAPCKSEKVRDA